MNIVQLKEICDLQNGYAFKSSDYLEYSNTLNCRMSNIRPEGYFDIDYAPKYLPDDYAEKYSRYLLKDGDLVIAMTDMANDPKILGVPTIVETKGKNLLLNQRVGKLMILDTERVYIPYLQYALNRKKIRKYYTKFAGGGLQLNIGKKEVLSVKIPLPPLPTQKKIAALLDEADKLRRLNAALLDKYDALTEAVFLEMFGDPVRNPNNFQVYKMDEICTKVTDGTHDTPERLKAGIKFITGKHIRPFQINYDNSDYVTEEVHRNIYRRCNPEFGDVLYTNIGVNLGTAALNIVEYEFSMKNVALLKPKKDVLIGRFLEHFLNSFNMKSRIKWMASIGGAQQFLSLTEIRRLKVIVPPLHLQTQFATRIQNIEAQKIKAQAALRKSEELFNALLQRSFSGKE